MSPDCHYGSIHDDEEFGEKIVIVDKKESVSSFNIGLKIALTLIAVATFSALFGSFATDGLLVSVQNYELSNAPKVDDPLSFEVYTENYGAHSTTMRAAYGYKAILEPHRKILVEPTNGIAGSVYKWDVIEKYGDEEFVIVDAEISRNLQLMITSRPPRQYKIILTETSPSGTVRTSQEDNVYSKYVRREYRSLSTEERDTFFDALEKVYSLSADEGVALYGDDFKPYTYFAAKHNSKNWCYHGGLQFLTTHAGFTLDLDKTLRSIDSSIITPYWDFTIDASEYNNGEWYKSFLYSDNFFGPVNTSSDDGYLIKSGRFQNISMIYYSADSNSTYYSDFDYALNSYSVNTDPGCQVPGELVTRSNEMCGILGTQPLPTCGGMISCFSDYGDNLANWEICLEKNVHANFHSINAGTQNCYEDWNDVLSEHPSWSGILSYVGPITGNLWYKYAYADNWVSCPSSCDKETSYDDCSCSPSFNVSSLNDTAVYSYLESYLSMMYSTTYMGENYVELNDGSYKWSGFSDDENDEINRFLLNHIVNLGTVGNIQAGSGPHDPLFFAFHPFFDRAFAAYRLSTSWTNGDISTEWTSVSQCTGASSTDLIPFSNFSVEFDLDYGIDGYYTNAQLYDLLDPSSDYVDYVFDNFDVWGNCSFNATDF